MSFLQSARHRWGQSSGWATEEIEENLPKNRGPSNGGGKGAQGFRGDALSMSGGARTARTGGFAASQKLQAAGSQTSRRPTPHEFGQTQTLPRESQTVMNGLSARPSTVPAGMGAGLGVRPRPPSSARVSRPSSGVHRPGGSEHFAEVTQF
jgi:hypothetical protein